jgi:hypothetical protein
MNSITTRQEKDKTTIIVPRRLRKAELDRVVNFLSILDLQPKKRVTQKQIQQLADEVNKAAWEKLKQKRGFTWL